jgi:hypothetical protein
MIAAAGVEKMDGLASARNDVDGSKLTPDG